MKPMRQSASCVKILLSFACMRVRVCVYVCVFVKTVKKRIFYLLLFQSLYLWDLDSCWWAVGEKFSFYRGLRRVHTSYLLLYNRAY